MTFVEKKHRHKRADIKALASTIKNSWEDFDSSVFQKVYDRWLKVLNLIIADGGDSTLVDSARGELLVPVVLPPSEDNTGSDDDF